MKKSPEHELVQRASELLTEAIALLMQKDIRFKNEDEVIMEQIKENEELKKQVGLLTKKISGKKQKVTKKQLQKLEVEAVRDLDDFLYGYKKPKRKRKKG